MTWWLLSTKSQKLTLGEASYTYTHSKFQRNITSFNLLELLNSSKVSVRNNKHIFGESRLRGCGTERPDFRSLRFWGRSCLDSPLLLSFGLLRFNGLGEIKNDHLSAVHAAASFQSFQGSLQAWSLVFEGVGWANQLSASSRSEHSQLSSPFSWSTRYTLSSLF